jgi:hypothetical protein
MLSSVQEDLAKSTLTVADDDALSILSWWRDCKQDGVEVFKNAVRVIMCIPAGSSLSEFTFSHTTRDVTKLRNRLGDDTLEMLTVVQSFLIHGDKEFDFEGFFEKIQDLVDDVTKMEREDAEHEEERRSSQKDRPMIGNREISGNK